MEKKMNKEEFKAYMLKPKPSSESAMAGKKRNKKPVLDRAGWTYVLIGALCYEIAREAAEWHNELERLCWRRGKRCKGGKTPRETFLEFDQLKELTYWADMIAIAYPDHYNPACEYLKILKEEVAAGRDPLLKFPRQKKATVKTI